MSNRLTQKDYFNMIIALAEENGRTDLVDFCNDRIKKLSRKTGSKNPTKTQVENETIKDVIRKVLTAVNKGVTVTELQGLDDTLGALSNQRISALLRQMIKVGEVVKEINKKKSYFSLVVGE